MLNNKWIIILLTAIVIVALLIVFKVNFSGSVGMAGKSASVAVQ